jgi:acetyltransferase-like isoleucine patch superfamily enzyme
LSKQAELRIGNETGFSGVSIGCAEKITIGNDCLIGANVLITDSDWHPVNPTMRKKSEPIKTKPVKIGNNVFIGVNSIVLKGSEIGNNSVIGAGSVVSGIIPPDVIAAGNPCKVIKTLQSEFS